MYYGGLLDNLNEPAADSYEKLRLMGATCVGTQWTAGTKHRSHVYQRLEEIAKFFYILRVGGHRQTVMEWLKDYDAAIEHVPDDAFDFDLGRIVATVGNEPNLEGWKNDPEGYGHFYREVHKVLVSPQPLFAVPSMGKPGWEDYLRRSLAAAGKIDALAVNVYGGGVRLLWKVKEIAPDIPIYITEINVDPGWPQSTQPGYKEKWLGEVGFPAVASLGAKAALAFILGGQSNGDWWDGYKIDKNYAHLMRYVSKEEEQEVPYEFKFGFKTLHDDNPKIVGEPLTDLLYDAAGNAYQGTTKGMLFWAKGSPIGPQFFKAALPLA